ncbi:ATP-binding protein [Streptomyces sp. NPDC058268]|uniref:ATP-binding protein n=1 Tax=Streptomyces sp. NPDC058268 TaxID=3346413 RepID=UPI0036E986F9
MPESVSRGRTLVSTVLGKWGMGEELADVGEVIVSELLTNVVNHTSTDRTTLAIHRSGPSRVRIEVADSSSAIPCIGASGGSAECGRGLVLVDALSSHWGYVKHPWGKVIWAELVSEW